ncbi:MAG: LAGLIDADG family homing endonuclease [Carbonactinosporaceae bacterium]
MTETVSGGGRGPGKTSGRRAKGLGFERIHTTAGVHPYDQVSWERRDVVMTNWRDGTVNFEQRGVEFPDFWSVNAVNIVTSKYFRGAVGTPRREWSLKQVIDRVVRSYVAAGEEHGYFAADGDAGIFEHELTYALLHQIFSFNSPVWFNVGTSAPQQVSACFILSVDDTMESILNWYGEEGMIFKGGSGSGINLSRLRSSKELLSSGGNASGPVSFMRGADASAGTIKSGGATRRAAKMVVLDVDHPDIEEFIETKAREEEKIRALRDAGFDMDLGGADITSVQYQNANNSVRVSDEFMRAVERGDAFDLHSRTTGAAVESVDARTLFRSVAQAAWACADPGVQYDDTINDWHTCPETGRITASNPCCFTGDTLVLTEAGPVAFEQLVKSLDAGEQVRLPSRDMTSGELVTSLVSGAWIAGHTTSLVDVVTDAGLRWRCTPEHRFLTPAGWVQARHLTPGLNLVPVEGAMRVAAVERVDVAAPVPVYDLEVAGTHNFIVTGDGPAGAGRAGAGVVVHNSEYMHLDNSSCNLASLNLLKFLSDDDTFDAERFARTVELVITAMDISICFADFPTAPIRDTTKAYRQLGIGYANLGALLMATGRGYDSEGGRVMAAAITSLMTGTAYKRSAEIAGVVGSYDGYLRNAEGHTRVMRKHAAANDAIRSVDATDKVILRAATKAWKACLATGEKHGWRNAQASVLAPTGCLTGDTLVTTSRGLARLSELGDVYGDRWQDLDVEVSTDNGARRATRFFVNGEEPTRRVVTDGGYRVHGTLTHRVKVVEPGTGSWAWKRLVDIEPGDLLPVQVGTLVGERSRVPLPALEVGHLGHGNHDRPDVPGEVVPELAELVGSFVGNGGRHAGYVSFRVAGADLDVVERLRVLSKQLFDLEPDVTSQGGSHEVVLRSSRLARWWQAAGFANDLPGVDHAGEAWTPRVPSALLEANDPDVYAAFLRGLFEAGGSVTGGLPTLSIASERFAAEIRTLMLTLGMVTATRRVPPGETATPGQGSRLRIGLRDLDDLAAFDELVGFIGERKARLLPRHEAVLPVRDYVFERVAVNEDGGVQPTYDLSVPDGLTYVAAGLVSHNTIGLMMDCDTTGIEPDLALVKFKKLVGGGSMQIVNQTVPHALTKLGYQQEQIEAIVEHIAEHGHVIDAPGLRSEHYEVFDCAMGERAIAPMGHVQMIAAVQPFLSGSVSKTINLPQQATVEDIEGVFLEGWKLGCKALAVYRDNCKVGQPLSAGKGESRAGERAGEPTEPRPVRRRLPKSRTGTTTSFSVGGAEGYMTANTYPDDGLGEVFLKMSKQGSTLAGLMDAFSVAVSVALQYGVPLETYVSKFVNMRFDPAGMTDDPDVRIAHSIVDYIFRRLALDHLPQETRAALGIYSADERRRQLEGGSGSPGEDDVDVEQLARSAPRGEPDGGSTPWPATPVTGQVLSSMELVQSQLGRSADAPLCFTCGTKMRPAGSCYVCEGCGSTSGCS